MPVQFRDYYETLGVPKTATEDEIREAYARMAKKFQPDRHAQLANYNFSLRAELEKIFSHISEAYRILSDPLLRNDYDSIFRSSGKMKIPSGADQRSNSNIRTPVGATPKNSTKR